MAEMAESMERECVVGAMLGQKTCPQYSLPCWVCGVLHLLTGTLRSVTEGRFDRFGTSGSSGRCFDWANADGETGRLWVRWPLGQSICIHRSEYKGLPSYWNSNEASEVRP